MSGERVRNLNLIAQAAARGWAVDLFCLSRTAPSDPPPELAATSARVVIHPFGLSGPARAARLLFDFAARRAVHANLYYDAAADRRLRAWVAELAPDVVVTSLHMFRYVPDSLVSRTLLDSHNAEGRRVERMARALGLSPPGIAARVQAGPVRAYERRAVERAARVVAVSEDERDLFEALAPGRVDVIPNGIDPSWRTRPKLPATREILFLGSMDYSANVDALRHLVYDVAPRIRHRDARVVVVGSNPGRAARRIARSAPDRVEIVGHVESTEPYFERARLLVVPLRFAGGTRLKILEALARGVPVATTTIGCEGLGVAHERELLIADGADALAGAIDRLLEDDALCLALSSAGADAVRRRFDWDAIGEVFHASLTRVADGAPASFSAVVR